MALALSDVIGVEHRRRFPNLEQYLPSPLFIYYNARKRAGHENHNIAVRPSDAMDAVGAYGVCKEAAWPYHPGRYRERPPSIAYEQALRSSTNVSFERLKQEQHALEGSLNEGIPFLFCLRLFPSNCRDFEYGETAATGRIKLPGDAEPEVRNHAMVAVGYDSESSEFLIRNSFGEEWGCDGHVRVSYEYMLHASKAYAFWRVSSII